MPLILSLVEVNPVVDFVVLIVYDVDAVGSRNLLSGLISDSPDDLISLAVGHNDGVKAAVSMPIGLVFGSSVRSAIQYLSFGRNSTAVT